MWLENMLWQEFALVFVSYGLCPRVVLLFQNWNVFKAFAKWLLQKIKYIINIFPN